MVKDIDQSAYQSARSRRRGWHVPAAMLSAAAMVAGVGVLASTSASYGATARLTANASSSFLACEVTDTGGISDRSFNASAYAGLKAAVAVDHNIVPKFLSSTSTSDYTPNIDDFLSENCGIIITVGFDMANATQTAAKANPKMEFAIVDCPGGTAAGCPGASPSEKTLPNIDDLAYETNQDGFLGGYLAAAVAKSNSIAPNGAVGEFGGENIPTVTIYMDGWVAGVRYYDKLNHKSVKVYGWYPTSKGRTADNFTGSGLFTSSFTDDDLGKTDTHALIGEGASVDLLCGRRGRPRRLGSVQSADSTSPGSADMEWVDTDGCISAPSGCSLFLTSVTKGILPRSRPQCWPRPTAPSRAATTSATSPTAAFPWLRTTTSPARSRRACSPSSAPSRRASRAARSRSNPCSYPAAAATPASSASSVCSGKGPPQLGAGRSPTGPLPRLKPEPPDEARAHRHHQAVRQLVANDDVSLTVEAGRDPRPARRERRRQDDADERAVRAAAADAGEIRVDGEPVDFADPGDAVRAGHRHGPPAFHAGAGVHRGRERRARVRADEGQGLLDRREARADIRRLSGGVRPRGGPGSRRRRHPRWRPAASRDPKGARARRPGAHP